MRLTILQGGIRKTVDVWRVVFVRLSTFRDGIRETIDVWRVAFARPSTFRECYSRDRQRSAPNIYYILVELLAHYTRV